METYTQQAEKYAGLAQEHTESGSYKAALHYHFLASESLLRAIPTADNEQTRVVLKRLSLLHAERAQKIKTYLATQPESNQPSDSPTSPSPHTETDSPSGGSDALPRQDSGVSDVYIDSDDSEEGGDEIPSWNEADDVHGAGDESNLYTQGGPAGVSVPKKRRSKAKQLLRRVGKLVPLPWKALRRKRNGSSRPRATSYTVGSQSVIGRNFGEEIDGELARDDTMTGSFYVIPTPSVPAVVQSKRSEKAGNGTGDDGAGSGRGGDSDLQYTNKVLLRKLHELEQLCNHQESVIRARQGEIESLHAERSQLLAERERERALEGEKEGEGNGDIDHAVVEELRLELQRAREENVQQAATIARYEDRWRRYEKYTQQQRVKSKSSDAIQDSDVFYSMTGRETGAANASSHRRQPMTADILAEGSDVEPEVATSTFNLSQSIVSDAFYSVPDLRESQLDDEPPVVT